MQKPVLIVVLMVVGLWCISCGTSQHQRNTQDSSNQNSAKPPSQTSGKAVKYALLREWQPNDVPNSYGAEILLQEELSREELTEFLKGLGQDKDPVSVSIYTDRKVYDESKKHKYGEGFKRHFIATYVKNLTGKGAFAGFNEIRWMQEKGKYADMFGKVTKF